MDFFEKKIEEYVKKAVEIPEITLEKPSNSEFGDYALPCFFIKLGSNPNESADLLKQKLEGIAESGLIEKMEAKGPYLNFFVNKKKIFEKVFEETEKEFDIPKKDEKEKVVVEFCSPNTNKPLHLGHLRNLFIGDSISKIISRTGGEIIKANLYNDKGIAMSKAMVAYEKFGMNETPETTNIKPDKFVGNFYILFEKNKSEEFEKQAQNYVGLWEQNNQRVFDLWKKLRNWSVQGYSETFKRLNINFDCETYESDIWKNGKEIILENKEKFITAENGAILAELEKYKLPEKVLLRADGTSLYITQDIYLAKKRFEEFKFNKAIYVVASEQKTYFQQLFAIFKILGFPYAEKCGHLSYGMIYLPEGKMKSREGTVIDGDDLISEMVGLAKIEVESRYDDLTSDEIGTRAEKIGIGALKFYMLKNNKDKDMVFDPKESLSFEGETGPYVQYGYARCSSVLKKSGAEFAKGTESKSFEQPEFILAKKIFDFKQAVAEAEKKLNPAILAKYLVELTQTFNSFYKECPVIGSGNEQFRINLVYSVKKAIKEGLGLLGIEVLEEM